MLKSKVQNQLHELIKSLSQTEKRYFKLIAQIQTQKKTCDYVLLFDAIDKQTEFNEDKIKAIFKGTPIEKRYASLKKYLYELILKSLSIYHFETKPSVKVRRMIDMAEILMTKGLYQQAKRRLEKTEKLAEEAGMIFVLHDIRRLKFECTQAIGVSFNPDEFEDFERTQNELTDELNVFNALYNQEMSPMKQLNIAKIEKTVDKEFDKLLLHSEHSICYTPTLHQAYSSAKSFYVETKNWPKMSAVCAQHFKEFKSKEFSISNWTEAYFTCLKDYILYCDISNPAALIEEARALLNEKGIGFINHSECIAETYIAELFCELKENTIGKVNLEEIEQFLNQYVNVLTIQTTQELGYYFTWAKIQSGNNASALKLNDMIVYRTSSLKTPILKALLLQNLLLLNLNNKLSLLQYLIKIIAKSGFKDLDFNAFENTARELLMNELYGTKQKLNLLISSLQSKELKLNPTFEMIFKNCLLNNQEKVEPAQNLNF